jgi:hypothetical protein
MTSPIAMQLPARCTPCLLDIEHLVSDATLQAEFTHAAG